MSGSVSEFLSKGNIKSFKSGIKSAFGRNLPKTLVASAVLAGAFAVCTKQSAPESNAVKPRTTYAVKENGDTLCAYQAIPMSDADYARLQKLVNAATKTESGCEILKGIAKAGTTLRLDYSGEDNLGYFLPDDNSICLGKQHGDADLQSVLIHECEHALQNQRVPQRTNRYNFESNLKNIRITEADAMTMQTLFSFEMAEQGDSAALKMMKIRHKGMVDTYAAASEKYGKGSSQALKETMLSWYDDKDYVSIYDETMAEGHAEALLSNTCQYKGVKYAGTDGSVLNTPRTAWLNVETRDKMANVSNRLVSKTLGFNGDESMDNFYMRKDGKVSRQTYKQIVATMIARQKTQGR